MTPPESRTPVGVRPSRIVIAEDDPTTRELLTTMVEGLGYTVIAVEDGQAALEAVAAQPPDLVISDVAMPRMNGIELCRSLKGDPRTFLIPFVLITASASESRLEGLEAGADEFLGKPVNPPELRVRMRALLRMKAFTDELDSVDAVLCSLGKSIEAKDPYTEGHCDRLARSAVAIGRVLGLPEADLTALRRGGYLHDLGKVSVPESILLKAGPLSPPERAVVRRHPEIGAGICGPLRSLQAVVPIIRHHHERWDGSGYPDGLRGDQNPLLARVLQMADMYDALTTDRPYRRALPPGEAFEILEAEERKGWRDPAILRAARAALDDSGV